MKLVVLIVVSSLLVIGCTKSSNTIGDVLEVIGESSKTETVYPPAELERFVAHVDINDDAGVVSSAGFEAHQLDTTGKLDIRGDPFKLFKFDKEPSAVISFSYRRVVIAWYRLKREPEASLKSLRIAQNVSRALMGNEGGMLVDSVMAGNKKAMIIINGVRVERAECSSGMCILHVIR